jgi:hypothetical protein
MQRTMSCLHLLPGLAAFAALPWTAQPSRADATSPSAWRFRTERRERTSQTLTVTQSGNYNWFLSKDGSGKAVRVVFPTHSGVVKREGKRVPLSFLRRGDQVEVWGEKQGGSLFASRAEVTGDQSVVGHR